MAVATVSWYNCVLLFAMPHGKAHCRASRQTDQIKLTPCSSSRKVTTTVSWNTTIQAPRKEPCRLLMGDVCISKRFA